KPFFSKLNLLIITDNLIIVCGLLPLFSLIRKLINFEYKFILFNYVCENFNNLKRRTSVVNKRLKTENEEYTKTTTPR
ncbi:hypothetical protein C1646_808829, partial [Rhizophagus diaphanus]